MLKVRELFVIISISYPLNVVLEITLLTGSSSTIPSSVWSETGATQQHVQLKRDGWHRSMFFCSTGIRSQHIDDFLIIVI